MFDIQSFATLIIILFVITFAFLILREGVCWYFKINEKLEVLREIREALTKEV